VQRTTSLLLVLAGGAALVVLYLVLRPGDDSESTPATTGATTARTATTPPPTEPQPPPPPPPPAVQTITIVVRDGSIAGGLKHASIPEGKRVRLVVSADVSDEVHLHGYDISRDVSPGNPAQIRFRATITGRFEVELESHEFQIADLEVRP